MLEIASPIRDSIWLVCMVEGAKPGDLHFLAMVAGSGCLQWARSYLRIRLTASSSEHLFVNYKVESHVVVESIVMHSF